MSERLDLAIEAYHDGTLDAAGAQLLAGALRDDPEARERLALTALLGQAFSDDESIVRSVAERIDAEQSASAVVRAVQQSIGTVRRSRPRRRSAFTSWWAAAAALLITLGAGWWLSGQQRPATLVVECRLVQATGVSVHRAGTRLAGVAELELVADDHLETTGPATLRWADGSQVVLAGGSRAVLIRPGTGQGMRLEAGALDAEISPQRAGLPFAIATAVARVDVLGTRFHLAAAPGTTTCDLHRGAVRVTRLVDARGLDLVAGQTVTVATDVAFVVRSSAPPVPVEPAAPSAPPLAEPAWSPLFPAAGLAGWQQQHGTWTTADGIIRGSDPQRHGKARLLSLREFSDLELTCRLRITGADRAEVQVGNYNWFVEVPARGGAWVMVQLNQRGATLTATADGKALTPQPGDGKAMRPGALGFYVMPGGTLEIADARIRSAP